MARKPDHPAGGFEAENTGGVLSGLLAEEHVFDRRMLWRLGSWGAGAVGAVIVAVTANQSALTLRRDQVTAADLARQSEQLQLVARESQNETRRLASAIDTLNGDRDRLYSRVTVLEQGLDSMTGAIARQSAAAASPPSIASAQAATDPPPVAQNPSPAPAVAAVTSTQAKTPDKTADRLVDKTVDKTAEKTPDKTTTEKPPTEANPPVQAAVAVASAAPKAPAAPAATPATPLVAAQSIMAPPDAAAGKLIEPAKSASAPAGAPAPEVVAAVSPAEQPDASEKVPKLAVQRTEFAVDVGGANSLSGLRALWRGLLKSNAALASLRPVIAIRESSTGLGMQLRLVAGPLDDAAAAAKICAGLMENERPCETTVFDGQRLAMKTDEQPATAKRADGPPDAAKPAATRPSAHRRNFSKRVSNDEPLRRSEPSLSSLFGKRRADQ